LSDDDWGDVDWQETGRAVEPIKARPQMQFVRQMLPQTNVSFSAAPTMSTYTQASSLPVNG
jgi:hypothetical protein